MGRVDTIGGAIVGATIYGALDQTWNVSCATMVNAAGPYAPAVGRLAGDVALPIHNDLHAKAIVLDSDRVVPSDCPMIICSDALQLAWSPEEADALRADPSTARWADELPRCGFFLLHLLRA